MTVASSEQLQPDEIVPMRHRLSVTAIIAVVSMIYTWVQHRYFLGIGSAPDSIVLWRGARMLMEGTNPWSSADWATSGALHASQDVAWRIALTEPMYYPMPAVVLWLPLALLPFLAASIVFNGIGACLFTFAVTRDGLHRAWLCGSIPFFIAMRFGQWSPLIAAAFVLPHLGAALLAKPNLGFPVWIARPTVSATIACLVLLVLPTLVAPWWIEGWLHNVTTEMGRATPHPVPLTMFGGAGVLLLLAALRWRRAEARLLLAMACLPQLPYWADQLPLLLAARSRREVIGLVLLTLLGMVTWLGFFVGKGDPTDTMRPISILCTYLPALVLILRRPNVGALPWPVTGLAATRL